MKRKMTLLAVVLVGLIAAPVPAAPDDTLDAMRTELTALTEALSAQIKLARIYAEMGKTSDEAATKAQILALVRRQQELLDRIYAAAGGRAAPAVRVPLPLASPGRPAVTRPAPVPSKPDGAPAPDVATAIGRALDWLASVQEPDGFWDCDGFGKHLAAPGEAADGPGQSYFDSGVSGLAVLAYLGAGETHQSGAHRKTIGRALKYLKQIQDPEGCFGPRTTERFIYNAGICTLAMCEAYALTGSPVFKSSAESGVAFILKAQNPYLAWRYGVRPQDNDTSVTGWMVAALHSAASAGIPVDRDAMAGALAWVDKMTEPEYGRVGYTTRGTGPARNQSLIDRYPSDLSESTTAEGILIRIFAGQDPAKSEMIQKGTELILKRLPTWDSTGRSVDMYYWYWGTLAMAHVGGQAWRLWQPPMRSVLLRWQRSTGDLSGSFDPAGAWGSDGGRIYSTAVMTMIGEILDRYAKAAGVREGK